MSKPPDFYLQAKEKYPEFFKSFEALSDSAKQAGPLDEKTVALVKFSTSIGAGLEGATHSGARKALTAGCTAEELQHAVLLAVTTLGFPSMMRARAWLEDVLKKQAPD